MADFPYISNPARLKAFLERIQKSQLGVPERVTFKYLESVGFKSKNDRAILTVLRALGFIDASGAPTQRWRAFRSTASAKAVMAQALRETYSTLFGTYENAQDTDNEALRNFFSSHTSVGEGALRFMVATFKVLAELADFVAEAPQQQEEEEESEKDEPMTKVKRIVTKTMGGGMTVNIIIQLTIPESDNPTIYENFFAAMKKNLFPNSE